MFRALRKHLTPSTAIAFLALVFAITGGAFAATGSGNNNGSSNAGAAKASAAVTPLAGASKAKKKAAPKSTRGPAGPKGATGATGATGPAGAAGPAGPAGGIGPQGPQGTPGTNGTDGTNGTNGAAGEPWTLGGTVPSGKSLKGEWGVSVPHVTGGSAARDSVSFALPLSAAPKPIYVREGETAPEHCSGSVESPGAAAGYLCVFAAPESETNSLNEFLTQPFPKICSMTEAYVSGCLKGEAQAADKFGFSVAAISKEEGSLNVFGTWAVTAP